VRALACVAKAYLAKGDIEKAEQLMNDCCTQVDSLLKGQELPI